MLHCARVGSARRVNSSFRSEVHPAMPLPLLVVAVLAATPLWSGRSGEFGVVLQPECLEVTQGGRTLERGGYLGCCGAVEGSGCAARLRPLSLIGPYLSYLHSADPRCDLGSPAHPWKVTSVDLRHRDFVDVAEVWEEQVLFAALSQDRWVRRVLRASGEAAPGSLKELRRLIGRTTPYSELAWPFYIHKLERDRLQVRVELQAQANLKVDLKTVTLGLLLPIPPPLREAVKKAELRNEGFVATDAPKGEVRCGPSPPRPSELREAAPPGR